MDLEAIWDGEWGRSTDECIRRRVEIVEGRRAVLGVNAWHPVVTNGDFAAWLLSAVRGGDAVLPKLHWDFLLIITVYTHAICGSFPSSPVTCFKPRLHQKVTKSNGFLADRTIGRAFGTCLLYTSDAADE